MYSDIKEEWEPRPDHGYKDGVYCFFLYYDPTYISVDSGINLSDLCPGKVQGTFQRYLREYSQVGMTGAQVARRCLIATVCMMCRWR